MIQIAIKNAELNNVSNQIQPQVMSVQEMQFENDTFDFAVGLEALHHLNLDLAGKEIARVLKPGGVAIFLEPRIPFKWLVYLRSILPQKCYESPGGGQLNNKEVIRFSKYFSSYNAQYFLFLKKLERFPVMRKYSDQLDKLDISLIKKFPFLRKLYFTFVLEFYFLFLN